MLLQKKNINCILQLRTLLLQDFRTKIRPKLERKKSSNKFKKEKPKNLASLDKTQLAAFHSGVMGLCAIVQAYPYDVPEMVPDILIEVIFLYISFWGEICNFFESISLNFCFFFTIFFERKEKKGGRLDFDFTVS